MAEIYETMKFGAQHQPVLFLAICGLLGYSLRLFVQGWRERKRGK